MSRSHDRPGAGIVTSLLAVFALLGLLGFPSSALAWPSWPRDPRLLDSLSPRPQTEAEKNRDLLRVAMSEIRSLAAAVESYSVDQNSYPMSQQTVVKSAELIQILQPSYIRRVPRNDPWGEPYRYWSNGGYYIILSGAADRKGDTSYNESLRTRGRDRPYLGSLCTGPTTALEQDIIFSQGQFCQWPMGLDRP